MSAHPSKLISVKRFLLLMVLGLCTAGLPARAADAELTSFRCDGGSRSPGAVRTVEAMENSYIEGTGYGGCWFHTGHHTYYLGGTYGVGRLFGTLFTVETMFSPPTDIELPDPTNRTTANMFFESSTDGVAWDTLRTVPFNFRIGRQEVAYDFDGGGRPARFLRVRQPRSAAQGLSGFLDSSNFDAYLTPLGGSPTQPHGALSLSCAQHVMERFFAEHPCWFGGINRYDSPSVFHTYAIGDASVDSIAGAATFAPWRTDDYYYDGGALDGLVAHVQVSANGVDWSTVGSFDAGYGTSAGFAFTMSVRQISFVRIVAEYMKDPRRHPALKHVRGIVVDSMIELSTT